MLLVNPVISHGQGVIWGFSVLVLIVSSLVSSPVILLLVGVKSTLGNFKLSILSPNLVISPLVEVRSTLGSLILSIFSLKGVKSVGVILIFPMLVFTSLMSV